MPDTSYEMVKEFHQKFRHPVGLTPDWISGERESLRLKLIEEEFDEVKQALVARDFENLAKELGDLIYVVNGFAVEAGIELDDVVAEIHRSNMTKLGADGEPIYREDGKVLKSELYEPPQLEAILFPDN